MHLLVEDLCCHLDSGSLKDKKKINLLKFLIFSLTYLRNEFDMGMFMES